MKLTPPESMRAAARRGLAQHKDGKSGDGLKPETVSRANRIADGAELTPEHVREMAGWFARHAKTKPAGDPADTPWQVAWNLWGGQAGADWSRRMVEQMDKQRLEAGGIFSLNAKSIEAMPAVTLGQGLPPTVNDQPAYYYWRQSIRDGKFLHPIKQWELQVTPERRRRWAAAFEKMLSNNVPVPVIEGHEGGGLGFVVGVRNTGPWLEELHQYIGDDARERALRQYVSVGINPNAKDGEGRAYGEAIIHSAIVPDPVVSGQGEAIRAASRGEAPGDCYLFAAESDQAMTANISEEQMAALKQLVGEDVTPENAVARLMAALNELQAGMTKRDTEYQASLGDAKTKAEEAGSRLAEAEAKLLELSKGGRTPDPDALEALAEADEAGIDALISAGSLTPDNGKRLKAALVRVDGKPVAYALSKTPGASQRLSKAVIEALKGNKPIEFGAKAPIQLSVSDGASDVDPDLEDRIKRVGGVVVKPK
jgi:hypothetical protein